MRSKLMHGINLLTALRVEEGVSLVYSLCPGCNRVARQAEATRTGEVRVGPGITWTEHGQRCTACGCEWGFVVFNDKEWRRQGRGDTQ